MSPEERGRRGPLFGLRVVEIVGIGPAPFCAMLLADLGAEVLRIDRPTDADIGLKRPVRFDFMARGRRSVAIDLKHPEGVACLLDLVRRADALVEGFRPGTMERLGLGPGECQAANPRLVYGRVTGWGQNGPLAAAAGHDLNYVALSGALHAIGRAGAPPTPPLNLVGDFAGGGLLLAFGLLAAILRARETGEGDVVDAAMLDGAALLMTSIFGLHAAGLHGAERGTNLLDSGAPHYDVYACADGRYVSVAPIEAKFRTVLLRLMDLPIEVASFDERSKWPDLRARLAARFAQKTRADWLTLLEGTDACVAPVLSMDEAPAHPQARARAAFVEIDGLPQPAPAPRFARAPTAVPHAPEPPGASTAECLAAWGIDHARLDALLRSGAIGRRNPS